MNAILDFLGKAGGILALVAGVVGFIFREYFKARLTDSFAKRIEQRRNARGYGVSPCGKK